MLGIFDSWYFVVIKIICISVYGFIAAAYGNEKLAKEITEKILFGDYIINNPLIVIFVMSCVAVVYSIVHKSFVRYASSVYDVNDLAITLLTCLEQPVGKKRERFAEAVDEFLRIKKQKYTPTRVFHAITQPEEQRKHILESLHQFLYHSYTDITFKVGLMSVSDNQIHKWEGFLPLTNPPRTEIAELSRKESTISRCIISKQIEIVSDVKKEILLQNRNGVTQNTRYIKGSTSIKEDGSQLCYPILSMTTKKVIYVITIAASRKNFFRESESDTYKWFLDRFSNRLALEHSLQCLVEKRCEGNL